MKSIEENLGSKIRERRRSLGMSQEQLAEKAKLHKTTINRMEKGKQPPRRGNLEAVAEALGCTREDLVTSAEDQSVTVESLLKALAEIQKEYKKLKLLNSKGNIMDSEMALLREKFSPETVTKMVRLKGLRLEVIKAIVNDNEDNIVELLEEVIASRERAENRS